MAPWSISKKFGRNAIIAIVSSTLNYIKPTNDWRRFYPNNYRQTRLQFEVDGLEQDALGKNVLKLSHVSYPHRIFTAFVNSVKLERPGSPNHIFSNDAQERSIPRAILPDDDNEEDHEPIEDGAIEGSADDGEGGIAAGNEAVHANNLTTDGEWNWSAFFDSIANDARGATSKNDPVMKHILNPQMLRTWNPIDYFNRFFPWGYIQLHVIPATNESLKEINKAETTMHEIKTWLGIWFLMSLNGQYSVDEFFETKTKSDQRDFFNPPQCGKYMSKGRFQRLLQFLRLTKTPPPAHRNRSWIIRDMIKSFNNHIETVFNPSWITCLNESMVLFMNEFCPNWVCVKCKPHPFGKNTKPLPFAS